MDFVCHPIFWVAHMMLGGTDDVVVWSAVVISVMCFKCCCGWSACRTSVAGAANHGASEAETGQSVIPLTKPLYSEYSDIENFREQKSLPLVGVSPHSVCTPFLLLHSPYKRLCCMFSCHICTQYRGSRLPAQLPVTLPIYGPEGRIFPSCMPCTRIPQ